MEWIGYHRSLGVDHFLLTDHGSTDGTREALQTLERAGLVTLFTRSADEVAPQLRAYDAMLRTTRGMFDWVGFLDADEFVVPERGASILPYFAAIPDWASGVALNWSIYGSSGQHFPADVPVTSRFIWRAPESFPINRHVKSFVRPTRARVGGPAPNPHAFPLTNGRYADGLGHPATLPVDGASGQSAAIAWDGMRINHYAVKSEWEFRTRKGRHPLVDSASFRHGNYYREHDRNDVCEPFRTELLIARDKGIAELEQLLRPAGTLPVTPFGNDLSTDREPAFDVEALLICAATGRRVLSGWAIDAAGHPLIPQYDLVARLGEQPVPVEAITMTPRPDIVAQRPGTDLMCGFSVHLAPASGEGHVVVTNGQYGEQLVDFAPARWHTVPRLVIPGELQAPVPHSLPPMSGGTFGEPSFVPADEPEQSRPEPSADDAPRHGFWRRR